jgi:tryptophan synthase alpha chain
VAKFSSGFVYLVSRTGVTGEQTSVSDSAGELVSRMRAITDLPLAVGFGISAPEHVAKVGATADGVVIGSAIVRTIEAHGSSSQLESELEKFMRHLAGGGAREARQS